MYKVSILVPIYNVEPFIEQCARSILEQTYNNLEYVFVDDCSPDNSISILKRVIKDYPKRTDQIKLISNKENQGASESKNIAIKNATGDFVCFVDADDWMEHDALELLTNEQQRTNADVVWGKFIEHTNEGDYLLEEPLYRNKHEWIICYCRLTTGSIMTNWHRIIRRSLLEQYNIRSVKGLNYAEDKLLMSQVAYYASSFSAIDDTVYHYNRKNILSATASQMNTFSVDAFLQENGSIRHLVEFFYEKETVYYEEVARARMRYLKEKLDEAVKYASRKGFNEVLRAINTSDHEFWYEIDWNTWKRFLYSNYSYMRYYPKIVKRVRHIFNGH